MDATELRAGVERYIACFNAADREAWLALFAPDATVEDPVGTEPHVGHEAIGAFWDMSHSLAEAIRLELGELVKPSGDGVAFAMRIITTVGGAELFVDVIEVQTYDAEGRIASMQAFWSMEDLAPLA